MDWDHRIAIIQSHLQGDQTAVELNSLSTPRVTLVGSCIMDVQAWIDSEHATGSSRGKVTFSPGGVCMNIARALKHLEKQNGGEKVVPEVYLVSAVGDDNHGRDMMALCSREGINTGSVLSVPGERTATVVVIFNSKGDAIQSVVDVSILEKHLRPFIALGAVKNGICVTDGDLCRDVIETVCREAAQRGCQVVFDPATVSKAPKCISVLKHIDYITPNIDELEEIARALVMDDGIGHHTHVPDGPLIFHKARACVEIVLRRGVKHVLLTAGDQGAGLYSMEGTQIHVEYSSPIPVTSIRSVNGAGDSLVAGFMYALSQGKNGRECLAYGLASAWEALQTESNVPEFPCMTRFKRHVAHVLRSTQTASIGCGCCCSICCFVLQSK